jgi:hypothetical protein
MLITMLGPTGFCFVEVSYFKSFLVSFMQITQRWGSTWTRVARKYTHWLKGAKVFFTRRVFEVASFWFSAFDKHVIDVELQIKEKFSCLLSEMAWPVFCRCLVKGKEFIDYNFWRYYVVYLSFVIFSSFLVMFSSVLQYFVIPNPKNIHHGAFIMLSSFDGMQIWNLATVQSY